MTFSVPPESMLTGNAAGAWSIGESLADPARLPAGRPRLLDQVRDALRVRHYSKRTERAYVGWIRRFIRARWERTKSRRSSRRSHATAR